MSNDIQKLGGGINVFSERNQLESKTQTGISIETSGVDVSTTSRKEGEVQEQHHRVAHQEQEDIHLDGGKSPKRRRIEEEQDKEAGETAPNKSKRKRLSQKESTDTAAASVGTPVRKRNKTDKAKKKQTLPAQRQQRRTDTRVDSKRPVKIIPPGGRSDSNRLLKVVKVEAQARTAPRKVSTNLPKHKSKIAKEGKSTASQRRQAKAATGKRQRSGNTTGGKIVASKKQDLRQANRGIARVHIELNINRLLKQLKAQEK